MKVTEKSLKTGCPELNLGPLNDTAFGVRVERIGSCYKLAEYALPEKVVTG